MKKLLYFLVLLCSTHLSAFDWNLNLNAFEKYVGWDAEFRLAAFRPSSELFREIYDDWGVMYQLESNKRLLKCSNVYGWINVGYYSGSGHSRGIKKRTRISLVPFTLGLKYMCCIFPKTTAYLGIGGGGTYVDIHDHDHFLSEHTHKAAWGGILKSGIRYNFWECSFFDFFVDYSYMHLEIHGDHRNNANVGGLMIGSGIGIYF